MTHTPQPGRTTAPKDAWRMGFHLMPPTGWLNDPNGLCQFRGTYHVFHQYSPGWPADDERGWGHATSTDLVHWEHHGLVIGQDIPEDANGAYSGSALVVPGAAPDGGDLLALYYTGNVKEPGDFDYVSAGRQANQILVMSEDGFSLSEKRVLLRNADYPDACSCHVRDPKLWRQDGRLWMLLGARDRSDQGMALVLSSEDGLSWDAARCLRADAPFGFMWECPDRIALDGHEYLAFCPQGMQDRPWANGLRDQSGYVALADGEKVADAPVAHVVGFTRWDVGFDFYAPQTFVDDAGRTILLGWMGLPEPPFESAPEGLGWIHCLTVPRELTRLSDGRIAQWPVAELETLRTGEVPLARAGETRVGGRRADLELVGVSGPSDAGFSLTLDGALELSVTGDVAELRFLDERVGAGRTVRAATLTPRADGTHDLRVLVDNSAVEVYVDGGATVFSTRWFPRAEDLTVTVAGPCAEARGWTMGDGMAATYER